MSKFNSKDFNLKEVIKDRVNREAEIEWAQRKEVRKLPRVEIVKLKTSAGLVNFFKSSVLEFRP